MTIRVRSGHPAHHDCFLRPRAILFITHSVFRADFKDDDKQTYIFIVQLVELVIDRVQELNLSSREAHQELQAVLTPRDQVEVMTGGDGSLVDSSVKGPCQICCLVRTWNRLRGRRETTLSATLNTECAYIKLLRASVCPWT